MSSRLEFLEEFLANNFALSDAQENTSGSLSKGSIADLTFLRTLLAIHQKSKSQVSGKRWTVLFYAHASLAASSTYLQPLLAYLNFSLDSKDSFCWYKWKKWLL